MALEMPRNNFTCFSSFMFSGEGTSFLQLLPLFFWLMFICYLSALTAIISIQRSQIQEECNNKTSRALGFYTRSAIKVHVNSDEGFSTCSRKHPVCTIARFYWQILSLTSHLQTLHTHLRTYVGIHIKFIHL